MSGYVLTGDGGDLLRVWHLGRRELIGSLTSRGCGVFHPDGRPPAVRCDGGGHRYLGTGIERPGCPAAPPAGPRDGLHGERPWRLDPRRPATRRQQLSDRSDEWEGGEPRVAVILELETGRVLADWRSQVGNAATLWVVSALMDNCWQSATMDDDPASTSWNVRRGAAGLGASRGTPVESSTSRTLRALQGYLLATSSWDNTTRLWDGVSGEPLVMGAG